ncbi:hypothetical protein [Macrococcus capreoli]|uniref:hypothetical protein n=1 Tax=Macrococcus capreoli TaxID=2982690 RepID=UPI0021D5B786|nr:hypothetical protein [Macrococcus sp. TMW 2.2395]MCU7557324.1 hypothetical protein [Macrococcus sp. TMW 2.2395]
MKMKFLVVLSTVAVLLSNIFSFNAFADEFEFRPLNYQASLKQKSVDSIEPNTVEKMIGDKIIKELKFEVVDTSSNLLLRPAFEINNQLSSSVPEPEKVVPSDGCGSTRTGYVNVSKSKIASLSGDAYTISSGVATYVAGAISATVGYYVGAGLFTAWLGTKLYLSGYSGVRFYYEYGWQYYYNSGCHRYTLLTGWNRY